MSDDALILRTVEETEPLNNKRGVTYRVQVVGGGGGGSGLPDQTGHSGEFLTTDGTDASWSDKPLVNTATGTDGLSILGGSGNAYGVSVGKNSNAGIRGVACGYNAATTAESGVAIGPKMTSNAMCATQIGGAGISGATNLDANTVKFANLNGNFEMMSADGTIPTARLTKVNSTITLTAAGWSSNSQTVNVTGMTADGVVMVSPDPTDQSAYTSAGVLCTAQAAGTLTFTCDTVPSADIDVNVVML